MVGKTLDQNLSPSQPADENLKDLVSDLRKGFNVGEDTKTERYTPKDIDIIEENAKLLEAKILERINRENKNKETCPIINDVENNQEKNKLLDDSEIDAFAFGLIKDIKIDPLEKRVIEKKIIEFLKSQNVSAGELKNHDRGLYYKNEIDNIIKDFYREKEYNKKEPLNDLERNELFQDIYNSIKTNLMMVERLQLNDEDDQYINGEIKKRMGDLSLSQKEKEDKNNIAKIINETTAAVLNDYEKYAVNKIVDEAEKYKAGNRQNIESEQPEETSKKKNKLFDFFKKDKKEETTPEAIQQEPIVEKEKTEEEKILDGKRNEYANAYKNFDKQTKNKYRKFVGDNNLSVPKINIALEEARKHIVIGDAEILKKETEPANLPPNLQQRKNEFVKYLTDVGLSEEIALEMYRVETAKVEYDGAKENLAKKLSLENFSNAEIFKKLIIQEYDTLREARIEGLPPKEKGMIRKLTDIYLKQNKYVRMAASTIIMTSAMYGVAWTQGLMSTAAFAYKGLARGARVAGGVGLGMAAGGVVEKRERKKIEKKYNEAVEKLKSEFSGDTKGFDKKFKKIEDEKSKDERMLLYKKTAIMLAAGASATAIAGIFEPAIAGGIKEATDYIKGVDKAGGTWNEPEELTKEEFYKNYPGQKYQHDPNAAVKEVERINPQEWPKTKEGYLDLSKTPATPAAETAQAAQEATGQKIIAEIEIKGKINTLSEAVEEVLKQEGVSDETKDNFINRWLGDKTEISAENRDELLNKAIRKLSVANMEIGDDNDIQNLVYEGNRVQLKADGNFEVIKGEGIGEAKTAAESELRQNAEAMKSAEHLDIDKRTAVLKEIDETDSNYKLKIPEKKLNILGTEEYEEFKKGTAETITPEAETPEKVSFKLNEYSSLNKYDYDGDGFLNEEEILYANKEIDFEIEKYKEIEKDLANIWASDDTAQNYMAAQHPGEIETIKNLKIQRDLLAEPLAKIRAAEINSAEVPEAKITPAEDAAPKTPAKIIPEKSLGQLSAEANQIEGAALNGKPEFFTGFNLGNIVENKPNLEKGIIEISYPDNNNIDKLIIDLKEKHFIIDDRKELREFSWKYKPGIDSMEKIKNYIHEELEKRLIK